MPLATSKRHITTFGSKNLRTLRAFKGIKNIRQLRVMYPGKTDDDIYFAVATEFNNKIDEQNPRLRQRQSSRKMKATADNFIATLSELPVAASTKKSREERLQNRMTDRVLRQHTSTMVEKKRYNRKALNGVFEDVVYDFDNEMELDIIEDVVFDTVMHRYSKQSLERNLHVGLLIEFVMDTQDTEKGIIYHQLHYNSQHVIRVLSPTQIREWADNEMKSFYKRLQEIGRSNLNFSGIKKLHIQFSEKRKVRGGSYIELPKSIQLKHACVNVKNDDQKCLVWSLLAYKYYDTLTRKDKNMVSCYKPHESDIIVPEGITFPVCIRDISKFEKANNLKINVFRLDGDKLQTVYNTTQRNVNVVNLLMLEANGNNHFVWIRDLARLICQNKNKAKSYACSQCLEATYDSDDKLQEHVKLCMQHDAVKVVMPTESNNKITFRNHGRSFKHPFAVFMDFESTLEECKDDTKKKSKVEKYQLHKINSVGYKYNCIYDEYSEQLQLINNSEPEVIMERLICDLERLAKKSYELTQQHHKQYELSPTEKRTHFSNKQCEYCACSYDDSNKKVVHHDHITGKYIATVCNRCNLQHTYERFLPVYIHNLKGYDSHFLVPYLMKYGTEAKDVSCIPNNEERYISFSKKIKVGEYSDKKGETHDVVYEIRFLDTLAFMATSLDSLATNLRKSCNNVSTLRQTFKNISEHFSNDAEFKLMIQKGVYPYEYVDKYDKLNENKLPPKQSFYSKLTDSSISTEEYSRAKLVWNKFKCNTLLDYHNLYLASDVLLLADIWENFKNVCYRIYNLDATYYYTAPSLSWDAFLKHNHDQAKKENKKFEIELLTDIDMMLMVEGGIRGGLSQISKRYAKANHEGMASYDKSKDDAYILYLDANNLYGYAMSQYLPIGSFRWNSEEWTNDRILGLGDKDSVGYLFEVDLHYPQELHDLHNGYALAPELRAVYNYMLNEWQQYQRKDTDCKKLISSFYDKKNYVVHYRLLKLYLKLGLKLTKVHRVLQFNQSNFMESYILKNTDERKKAANDFEKDFYKLMNNSVYGKTMENVRNRINFSLVSSEEKALNFHNTLKKRTIFNESCVGVHLLKREVKLNKPVFIGQCVLDESKLLMNDFHYNFMLKKFKRENIDLLFTDTDSLCYEIRKQNPYEVIAANKERFDLSSYPKDHPLYDATNKKVIAKFKNEAVDGQMDYITEVVGLRSKMYSYTTEIDSAEHHRCKGVKKYVVEKQFKTKLYKDVLHSRESHEVKQNGFRSYEHQLYTETVQKIGLSCRDDKCYIQDDNIHTYTLGHYATRK